MQSQNDVGGLLDYLIYFFWGGGTNSFQTQLLYHLYHENHIVVFRLTPVSVSVDNLQTNIMKQPHRFMKKLLIAMRRLNIMSDDTTVKSQTKCEHRPCSVIYIFPSAEIPPRLPSTYKLSTSQSLLSRDTLPHKTLERTLLFFTPFEYVFRLWSCSEREEGCERDS